MLQTLLPATYTQAYLLFIFLAHKAESVRRKGGLGVKWVGFYLAPALLTKRTSLGIKGASGP